MTKKYNVKQHMVDVPIGSKIVCFYHRDNDGIAAAAILAQSYGGAWIAINYGEPIDMVLIKDQHVFMVDFSVEPKVMQEIIDTALSFTWIDHHERTIKKVLREIGSDYLGKMNIFTRVGTSGCELTWLYLHGGKYGEYSKMPNVIEMLGAYDVAFYTKRQGTNLTLGGVVCTEETESLRQNVILPFQYAMIGKTWHPTSQEWTDLLKNKNNIVNTIIQEGCAIWAYLQTTQSARLKEGGFKVIIDGIRFAGIFSSHRGSPQFGTITDREDIDAMIVIIPTATDAVVSLYCDNVDFDMSAIAAKHGGGGHRGASGFVKPLEYVLDMIKDRKPL